MQLNFDLKPFPIEALFSQVCWTNLLKTLVKGEITRNEQFLPFLHFFSNPFFFGNFLPFLSNSKLSSANSFSLEESKICRLKKDLIAYFIITNFNDSKDGAF